MRQWLKSLACLSVVATLAGGSGHLAAADPGAIATERAEPPVEIYSRVARGALRCWFGAQGSLKKYYVFHADVAPPSSGSGAEIAIYERDKAGQTPRSIRAFRISIASTGSGSKLQSENFRMAPEVARDMSADLGRWVQGQDTCGVVGIGGWKAEQAPLETASVPPPLKPKKKKIAAAKAEPAKSAEAAAAKAALAPASTSATARTKLPEPAVNVAPASAAK